MSNLTEPVDLQKFCGDAGTNFRIGSPFNKGAFTYATNGHIMVRVPLIAGHREDGPNAEKLYEDAAEASGELFGFTFPKLPPLTVKTQECEKCNGSGAKHDCPGCACDCEECEGKGNSDVSSDSFVSVKIGGVDFACEYIRLLCELPRLSISEPRKEKSLRFAFEGGEGLLMPLRASREKSLKVNFVRNN